MRITIGNSTFNVSSCLEALWCLLHGAEPSGDVRKSENQPPKPIAVIDPPPRVFALVIGINAYPGDNVLGGCVPDANDMEAFLRENLNVPADQIRMLRDSEATRSGIIKAFLDICDDPRIQRGDAIVIFYSGHGGETDAPAGWDSEGGKTQYLVPIDIYTKDSNGNTIQGIPDRTVGALINKIAREKGDNISVLFDCCHSGSGTRGPKGELVGRPRVMKLKGDVPSDLDKEIWLGEASRGASVAPGFAQTGLYSHVLLAACSAKESAWEDPEPSGLINRGAFSKNMLATLRTIGAEKLTYRDVLVRMPALQKQNPQCEGVNQDRILFNGKAPNVGRVFHKVLIAENQFVLQAGAAHGITEGAEFSIYEGAVTPITSPALGILVVQEVKAFTAILVPPSGASTVPQSGDLYAVQTKAGQQEDLRLNIALKDELVDVFRALAEEMQNSGSDVRKIQLVEADQNPYLRIDCEDGRVVFDNLDPLVAKYAPARMPYTVPNKIGDIHPVMSAAAHFKWHVDLTNPKHTLHDKVELQIMEVIQTDDIDADLVPVYKVGKNLNTTGEVYIDDDSKKQYAFKIVNNTDLELFPSLFYFDNSNFEITSFYQPPSAGKFKLDAPLQPRSSLTIGYGSGGHPARTFSLPDGRDVDAAFLQLFLSTQYVNYSNVPQPSPFRKGKGASPAERKPIQIWDSIKVAIVQKKGYVSNNW